MKRLVKAAFDKAFAGTALFFLVPVLGVIALAIALGDRGPVLFRQTRVGRHRRLFKMWKFRKMYDDLPTQGPSLTMRYDRRMTRVGRILERTKLASFRSCQRAHRRYVAGRTMTRTARRSDSLRRLRQRRLVVKPGIWPLAVNGRSNLPWDETVRLDVRYVENWSLFLDLQILWKTWSAVTHADGAY